MEPKGSLPLDPTQAKMIPSHILIPYFFKINLILSFYLHLSSGLFPADFLLKILNAFFIAIFTSIHHDLIKVTVFCEEYISQSWSMWSFLFLVCSQIKKKRENYFNKYSMFHFPRPDTWMVGDLFCLFQKNQLYSEFLKLCQ